MHRTPWNWSRGITIFNNKICRLYGDVRMKPIKRREVKLSEEKGGTWFASSTT